MTNPKKVLILTYFFPPANFAGSYRINAWAKYLKDYNYYPIIITRNWQDNIGSYNDISQPFGNDIIHYKYDNFEVYYLPYKGNFRDRILNKFGENKYVSIRKALTFFELLFQNFTNYFNPYRNIYDFSNTYLNNNKDIELIIASGKPFILFKFCFQLHEKYKIPWIADYRDEWTTHQWNMFNTFSRKFLNIIDTFFEKKWIQTCEFFISVSDERVKNIQLLTGKEGRIIMNGFDNDLNHFNQNQQKNQFEIIYNGSLYLTQDFYTFLDAFKEIIKRNPTSLKIKLNFIGIAIDKEITNLVSKYLLGYEDYYSISSRVPQQILINKQNEAQCLLMIGYNHIKGCYSSKIFDYVGSQKPIILCPSDNDVLEEILKDSGLGLICKSKEECVQTLTDLLVEYEKTNTIKIKPNLNYIQQFERKKQVKLLSEHFNSILKKEHKTILILAYDFPPYVSVGSLRPYAWFQHLSEFKVKPVIVTRQWSNKNKNFLDYIDKSDSPEVIIEKNDLGTIIKTPYSPNLSNKILLKYGENKFKLIRKIITTFYEICQFILLIGPKSNLFFTANKYLKNNKVDVIIASGEPFILFRYAHILSKKYNTKWIADYRDPWVQDKIKNKNFLIKKWNSFFEKLYLNNVHSIITVSSFCKKQISTQLYNKPFYIIPNGYNIDAISGVENIKQNNSKLSIAFIGTLYKWYPIEIFLEVCSNFIKQIDNPNLQINFYGVNTTEELKTTIKNKYQNLHPFVNFYPKIPNELLLKELATNNVFLLFNSFSYMGTKIYDYLALKRKIILCFGDDADALNLKEKYYNISEINTESQHLQEDIIHETKAGLIVKDAEHLYQVLNELYIEFSNNGFIACNSMNTEKFSRKIQTKNLAEIIHTITSSLKNTEIPYQQCTRCVMDTSDLEITFNEEGHCNHCTEYYEKTAKLTYQGETSDKKLLKLIEKIKKAGKNKDFDCVLGISGGIDSCYAAYIAKQYGLRVLTVHMDNGWNSDTSVKNIKHVIEKLELDYQSYVLDWEEFRDLQLAFLKASVPEAETPTDIAIPAALHKIAAKHAIKYIISGGNFATEGILPKSWHYNAKDVTYLNAIQKRFGTVKLKSFPTFGYISEFYFKFFKGIRIIYLLNYVNYSKKDAQRFLEEKLEWKYYGGKHYESKYTGFLHSYMLPEKFNIDYRRATFSTQICAGEITREEALKQLENKPYNIEKAKLEKEYICKKLSISLDEFNSIMALPPKSYKDYPNDKDKLSFIYTVYRKLRK